MIHPDLLELLGCPLHDERPPFELRGNYLVCTASGHGFPIVDGIPHLLPEDVIEPNRLEELIDERDKSV